MGYRDEVDGLRALRDALRASGDDPTELARVQREIEQTRKHLRVLSRIRVASPCTANWDAMVGDDRARHCALCEKNVYDFTGLTAAECVGLIERSEGELCARFYRRKDGTILTADCQVGRRRARRRAVALAGSFVVATAAAAGVAMMEGETRVVRAEPLVEVEAFELDESAFLERPNEHLDAPIAADELESYEPPQTFVMGAIAGPIGRHAHEDDLERYLLDRRGPGDDAD